MATSEFQEDETIEEEYENEFNEYNKLKEKETFFLKKSQAQIEMESNDNLGFENLEEEQQPVINMDTSNAIGQQEIYLGTKFTPKNLRNDVEYMKRKSDNIKESKKNIY